MRSARWTHLCAGLTQLASRGRRCGGMRCGPALHPVGCGSGVQVPADAPARGAMTDQFLWFPMWLGERSAVPGRPIEVPLAEFDEAEIDDDHHHECAHEAEGQRSEAEGVGERGVGQGYADRNTD